MHDSNIVLLVLRIKGAERCLTVVSIAINEEE